jgi:hypothetical protein
MHDQTGDYPVPTERYAKCIEVSKRVRWDIDRDIPISSRFSMRMKRLF